jgi:trimethylamine:corrinoid methyltransferase-like protein
VRVIKKTAEKSQSLCWENYRNVLALYREADLTKKCLHPSVTGKNSNLQRMEMTNIAHGASDGGW